MTNIKSITTVQKPGAGWVVRIRLVSGEELFHGSGAWTMHQAQVAADSLRRDIRNHGEEFMLGEVRNA